MIGEVSIGVGSGDSNLFLSGSYEACKALQDQYCEMSKIRRENKLLWDRIALLRDTLRGIQGNKCNLKCGNLAWHRLQRDDLAAKEMQS